MDVADRIKKSTEWTPLAKRQENTKNAQIGQWAANIDNSAKSGPAYSGMSSSETSSMYSLPHSVVPANTGSIIGIPPFSSASSPSQSPPNINFYRDDRQQNFEPLIDLSDNQSLPPDHNGWGKIADARFEDSHPSPDVKPSLLASEARKLSSLTDSSSGSRPTNIGAATLDSTSATQNPPKLASSSHIHRLAEPVSTRKRSKKEDIILLKASVVNGFKCPPWDKNPATTDFTPQDGQDIFV